MASYILRLCCFKDFCKASLQQFIGRALPTLHAPPRDLTGKAVLVTGANSGLGKSLCEQLAAMNATVYMACRSFKKGEAAAESIRTSLQAKLGQSFNPDLRVLQLDTGSFESVRTLVRNLPSDLEFELIYHNAGFGGAMGSFTADGQELTYQTNFLSSFLLSYLLETEHHLTPTARTIFTSSYGQYHGIISPSFAIKSEPGKEELNYHYIGASPAPASTHYPNSKLFQAVCARLLQQRYDKSGSKQSAHSFSPGYAASDIFNNFGKVDSSKDLPYYIMNSVAFLTVPTQQGAVTGILLGTKDLAAGENGHYWERCEQRVGQSDVLPEDLVQRLWVRWCNDCNIEWI